MSLMFVAAVYPLRVYYLTPIRVLVRDTINSVFHPFFIHLLALVRFSNVPLDTVTSFSAYLISAFLRTGGCIHHALSATRRIWPAPALVATDWKAVSSFFLSNVPYTLSQRFSVLSLSLAIFPV